MRTIKLNHQQWKLDENSPLAKKGGFGQVFEGYDSNNDKFAIKKLGIDVSDSANREIAIGEKLSISVFKNVVPIVDYGQDADSNQYFLVMPVCSKNLQEEIDTRGALSVDESLKILLEILNGLKEVDNIVHRDLKPQNILFYNGSWRIADFGIAKFVEDSTSLNTLKGFLSKLYAAPEQWRSERATQATDIYAIACIAYVLITGSPPFYDENADLQKCHLHESPKIITQIPPKVSSLLLLMLRKPKDIRPSIKRCVDVFSEALDAPDLSQNSVSINLLHKASVIINAEESKKESDMQVSNDRKKMRDLIFDEMAIEVRQLKDSLFETIKEASSMASNDRDKTSISFGKATITFDVGSNRSGIYGIQRSDDALFAGDGGWGVNRKQSDWDIIAYTKITLEQKQYALNPYEISANLVLGRPDQNSEYRWYEMSFFSSSGQQRRYQPFALDYPWEIDLALSRVMSEFSLAYDKPSLVDGENVDSFISYWIQKFADAALGKLERARHLPFNR